MMLIGDVAKGDKLDGLEASLLKKAKIWDCTIGSRKLYIWKILRDRESWIVSGQNLSIRTNLVKTKIRKSQKGKLCRLHKKADECIGHVVKGCSKLA